MPLPFRSIVCAIDFAPGSARALVAAADLAERGHAALHLVHVTPVFQARLGHAPSGDPEEAFRRDVVDFANASLGAANAFEVVAPGLERVRGVPPADGILIAAKERGAGLIVVGTHGRQGLGHLLMGSVAAEVLRRSPVPVLVVPERAGDVAPGPGAPVVAAVDFSVHARPTLALADAFAVAHDAPLVLLHALDVPLGHALDLGGVFTADELGAPAAGRPRTLAHLALSRLAAELTSSSVTRRVAVGGPEAVIGALAAELSAGAVVLSTHGRAGRDRLLHGSVAEWVARHAACPVVVAPPPQPADGPGAPRAQPSHA